MREEQQLLRNDKRGVETEEDETMTSSSSKNQSNNDSNGLHQRNNNIIISSDTLNVSSTKPAQSFAVTRLRHDNHFEDVCDFALRFGLAAYRYGSIGTNIEHFVVALVQHLGYSNVTCRLTQSELLLCVVVCDLDDDDDDDYLEHQQLEHSSRHIRQRRRRTPQMWMVDAVQGNNLDKLSQLADLGNMILADPEEDLLLQVEFDDDDDDGNNHSDNGSSKQEPLQQKQSTTEKGDSSTQTLESQRVLSNRSVFTPDRKLSLKEATRRLKEIDRSPNPFGLVPSFLSWVGVGFALPPVFGSSWYDVLLGAVLAGLNFWITHGMAALSKEGPRCVSWIAKWDNLVLGFVPGLIASIAKVWWTNQINVAIVVVAAIAIPIPGYGISLGVIELVYNRITPGFGHLIQGIVVLIWLALGASIGIEIIRAIQPAVSIEEPVPLIGAVWQFLMVPILTLTLVVAFQNSYRDIVWSVLCQIFSYIMSYVGSLLERRFLGSFFSAVAFTVFANSWALYYNRPNTIIFAPSFVLSISGTIGFRGLLNLNVDEKGVGFEQFLDMLIVALVTLVGIIAGSSLVQPRTTL